MCGSVHITRRAAKVPEQGTGPWSTWPKPCRGPFLLIGVQTRRTAPCHFLLRARRTTSSPARACRPWSPPSRLLSPPSQQAAAQHALLRHGEQGAAREPLQVRCAALGRSRPQPAAAAAASHPLRLCVPPSHPQAVRRARGRVEQVTGVEPPLPKARKSLVGWLRSKVCCSPAAESGEAVAASPAAVQAEGTVA